MINITAQLSITRPVIPPPEPHVQPVPIFPGSGFRGAHDFECNDPRHGQTKGYVPRTYQQKETIPEAFKYDGGDSQNMTLEWSRLWRDCLGMYAPQTWKTQPADLNDGKDWSWFNGFIPATELDKWYLHLIHGARAYTNKTGPNDLGYCDFLTGFGTGTNPFRMEAVDCGGNYYWRSTGNRFWCLDGLAPAPTAEQVKDNFALLHVATQSSPVVWDATPRPDIDCPNGIWYIPEFPQAGGNIVVRPMISTWSNGSTMEWNGLHLREGQLDAVRVKPWPASSYIPWPNIPKRDLIVNW